MCAFVWLPVSVAVWCIQKPKMNAISSVGFIITYQFVSPLIFRIVICTLSVALSNHRKERELNQQWTIHCKYVTNAYFPIWCRHYHCYYGRTVRKFVCTRFVDRITIAIFIVFKYKLLILNHKISYLCSFSQFFFITLYHRVSLLTMWQKRAKDKPRRHTHFIFISYCIMEYVAQRHLRTPPSPPPPPRSVCDTF